LIQAELDTLVGNVLDAFGDVHPDKIIIKVKLHLLTHLGQDIRRFGPAIRSSTEVFECFNAIFRLCSIYSNHQAASRDIAYKFSSMDRLKHILSGGYWLEGKEWVQAGQSVLRVLWEESIIQRHLGWVSRSKSVPGELLGFSYYKPSTLSIIHFCRLCTSYWKTKEATVQMGDDIGFPIL